MEIRLKCNNAHFKQGFFILRPRILLSSFEKKLYFTVLEGRKCKRLWLVDFVNLALKYSILLSKIMSRAANIKLQFIFVLRMNEWEWQLCHLKRRQSLALLCVLCVHSASARCSPEPPVSRCHSTLHMLFTFQHQHPQYSSNPSVCNWDIVQIIPVLGLQSRWQIVFKVVRQNTHRYQLPFLFYYVLLFYE